MALVGVELETLVCEPDTLTTQPPPCAPPCAITIERSQVKNDYGEALKNNRKVTICIFISSRSHKN